MKTQIGPIYLILGLMAVATITIGAADSRTLPAHAKPDRLGRILSANARWDFVKILGIGCSSYHDPSAALLVDGEIVAAAEEERFTRR